MNRPMQNGARHNGTQPHRWTQALPASILLVEDEPAVRMVTREALELGGYRVIEADGPATALRIVSENSTAIDLLLTDMIMPGMNGAELARRVREQRPGLVTLFMTGYAAGEALRLATLEAKQRHIQKPFTVSNLLARIADAIASRWSSGDELQAPQHPSP
ncbi:MAG TPA: response regulator [Candidatus Angelobacter sp.]|nr:response regulator [Candidatus Angelobacter sp.]